MTDAILGIKILVMRIGDILEYNYGGINMERKCYTLISILILFVLFGCKHNNKGTQPSTQTEPPLVLVSMKIYGQDVVDKKVTLTQETIKEGNIIATFNYGKVTNKIIPCIIEGGEFTLDKVKPRKLHLSVAKVEKKHQAWSEEIEVTYEVAPLRELKDELVISVENRFSKAIQGLEVEMLPDSFIEGLNNGSEPELEVPDVMTLLKVFYRAPADNSENLMKEVEFDINGVKTTIPATQPDANLAIWKAETTAMFIDKNAALKVIMTVRPNDASKYKDAVFKFTLKSLGIMPVLAGYNGRYHQNGTEETLEVDVAEFLVQCYRDVIQSVTITDGKTTHTPEVKKYKNSLNIEFWSANQKMSLNKSLTTYTITIIPANTALFNTTVYTYKLKGKPVPKDNAEFVYVNGEPKVQGELVFKSGCESKYLNSYGLTKIKIFTATVNPKAKVHYKMINPITKGFVVNHGSTITEGVLTSDGLGGHHGEITVLEDKPTHLMLYVVAEDGYTQDSSKGRKILIMNEMDLFWDVEESHLAKKAKRRSSASQAYDVIEIEKEKAKNNGNKFYLCFTCLQEAYGTKVADSVVTMEGFKKLDKWGISQAYQLTLDATKLITNEKAELDLEIPLLRTTDDDENPITPPVSSFTYRIKIKLAE